jgi:hypothetical protein
LSLVLSPPKIWSQTPDQPAHSYLQAYLQIQDATALQEKANDLIGAYIVYHDALIRLRLIASVYPNWEPSILAARIKSTETGLAQLSPKVPLSIQLHPESHPELTANGLPKLFQQAQSLEAAGRVDLAEEKLWECLNGWSALQTRDPGWQPSFVQAQIIACTKRLRMIEDFRKYPYRDPKFGTPLII